MAEEGEVVRIDIIANLIGEGSFKKLDAMLTDINGKAKSVNQVFGRLEGIETFNRQMNEINDAVSKGFIEGGKKTVDSFLQQADAINVASTQLEGLNKRKEKILSMSKTLQAQHADEMNGLNKNIQHFNGSLQMNTRNLEKNGKAIGFGLSAARDAKNSGLVNWLNRVGAGFEGWAMSLTFLGMMIQRAFLGIMQSGVQTFTKIMQESQIAGTNIQLFSAYMDILKFTIGSVIEAFLAAHPAIFTWIEQLINWIDKNQELVGGLIMFGIIIGTVAMMIGQLTLGAFGIIGALGKVGSIFQWFFALFAPAGPLTGWASFTLGLQNLGGLIFGLIPAILILGAILWSNFGNIWVTIADTFKIVWDWIVMVFSTVMSIFKELFAGFIDLFKGDWEGFGQHMWNVIKLVFAAILKTIAAAVALIVVILNGAWNLIASLGIDIFGGLIISLLKAFFNLSSLLSIMFINLFSSIVIRAIDQFKLLIDFINKGLPKHWQISTGWVDAAKLKVANSSAGMMMAQAEMTNEKKAGLDRMLADLKTLKGNITNTSFSGSKLNAGWAASINSWLGTNTSVAGLPTSTTASSANRAPIVISVPEIKFENNINGTNLDKNSLEGALVSADQKTIDELMKRFTEYGSQYRSGNINMNPMG